MSNSISKFILYFGLIGSVCSVVSIILSLSAMNLSTESIQQYALYSFVGFSTVIWIFFYIENKKLKSIVNDGLKYSYNEVAIVVDIEKKKYKFCFEKHFTVITDENPKWYKGQFYCNTKLESSAESQEFYKINTPRWDDLKMYASLKYQRPRDKTFTSIENLKVQPITDNSYYIPFHIHFEQNNAGAAYLSLEKGTKIELTYGYEVSSELWGSYINRTLSFFAEKAIVSFTYPKMPENQTKLKLHKISKKGGEPELIEEVDATDFKQNNYNYKLDLPKISSGKFRIYWESDKILGVPNSKITADDSKMTDF